MSLNYPFVRGIFIVGSSSERFAETPPIVTTTGAVQAVEGGFATHKFYDIPYAKPPVGALRWRAPEPLPASDSLLPRLDPELMCPQEASEVSGIEGDAIIGVEDCLYLDVYAPAQVSESLPVMFWIPGGGNTTGRKGTNDFSRQVAEQNVVVVAINYRLGPGLVPSSRGKRWLWRDRKLRHLGYHRRSGLGAAEYRIIWR